jgi:large subunit ribosomal protein L4
MATVPVLGADGEKVSDRDLSSELFEAKVSVPLMHQVVVAGMASLRRGTHSTKTRGDVSGGGRKPWRQKGTGRARQGSTRAPQWTGGGVVHGPHPRDHDLRVNKKMKKGALRSALTDALQSGKLVVLDEPAFDEPKTSRAAEILDALGLEKGRFLLVVSEPSDTGAVEKSFRNIRGVRVTYARSLGVYELLAADKVILTTGALDALESNGRREAGSKAPEEQQPEPDEDVPAEEQEVGE